MLEGACAAGPLRLLGEEAGVSFEEKVRVYEGAERRHQRRVELRAGAPLKLRRGRLEA